MDKWEYLEKSVDKKLLPSDPGTLSKYARKVPKGGVILDIGTCAGGSAFIMALANPDVFIHTIDPTPSPRFYDHRKALDLEGRIKIYEMKSQDMTWDIPLDLIFDDGLHQYEGVKRDIEIFYPHVKKGGYCMFHDFRLYTNTVGKAILEGENKVYKRLEVVDNIYIGERI